MVGRGAGHRAARRGAATRRRGGRRSPGRAGEGIASRKPRIALPPSSAESPPDPAARATFLGAASTPRRGDDDRHIMSGKKINYIYWHGSHGGLGARAV